jgi:hypothetical protein
MQACKVVLQLPLPGQTPTVPATTSRLPNAVSKHNAARVLARITCLLINPIHAQAQSGDDRGQV